MKKKTRNLREVIIYSEMDELGFISGIRGGPRMREFTTMWYADLQQVIHDKPNLIKSANSILAYFDCRNRVSDVDYDPQNDCLLWEVQTNVA